jgi:hypothetical protein
LLHNHTGSAGGSGAGRWAPLDVEENFQTGKGCTGLDQHQVRTWTSWYRWTTLVMLGHLLLVAATIIARAAPWPRGSDSLVAQRNPTSPDPRHPAQPAIGRRC